MLPFLFPPKLLYFLSTFPGVSSCPIQKPRYPVTDLINSRHFGFWADAQVNNAAGFSRNAGDLMSRPAPSKLPAFTCSSYKCGNLRFLRARILRLRSRAGAIILRISLNSNSEFHKNIICPEFSNSRHLWQVPVSYLPSLRELSVRLRYVS